MGRIIQIPGMVDPHTHLRDLNWKHKGTFASETKAAVAGGYWAVFDMPNTSPPTITCDDFKSKRHAITGQAVCDWGLYFGASQNDNTGEYLQVWKHSCALKIYNNATTGDLLIRDQSIRARHYQAWPQDKIIAVHAEDETVLDILELVRRYRKRTHFLHISSAKEIQFLKAAKEEGLPITVGVCPHHLFLTEDDARTLGAYAWMKPELKTRHDQNALWEAIQNNIVDIIESDHAPHTIAEKESDNPPYGVPGLETTLPLMLTAVSENRLSFERLIELVATNPRKIWGLECPPETCALVDLGATYIIQRENLHTLCGWSPFEGMRAGGRVLETWIRGVKVFNGEAILAQEGCGRNLFQ